MDRKDPAMPEQTTTAGTDDRRPGKVEEVWLAIGPFTPIGRRAVVRAAFFLIVLGTAAVLVLWAIHRDLVEHNQIMRAKGG